MILSIAMTKRNSLNKAIWPLLLIIFIDSLGYMLIIPVFLRIIIQTGDEFLLGPTSEAMRNVLFGVGLAIGPFAYTIGAPFLGTWSDKWGRKKTLLLSLMVSVIGFILPVIGLCTGSLALVFAGRALAGLASSSQPLAQAAVADISEGERKAFYFGMTALAMTLSLLVGPAMGGYLSDPSLVSWFSDATPFYATLVLLLIAIILLAVFYKETHVSDANKTYLTSKDVWWAIKEAFTNKQVRVLFLVLFLFELGWSFYYQDVSLFLTHQFNYSVNKVSTFMMFGGIWMALGLTLLYRMVIYYLSLTVTLISCLAIATLAILICAFSSAAWVQWVFMVPAAIATGMAYPTVLAMLSNRVSDQHQGWVLGVAAAVFAAPWGISGFASGPLTNINLYLPLQIAGFSFLLSFIVLFVWEYFITRHRYP